MGHAAGVAASLVAASPGATVQGVDLPRLQQLLTAQGVRFSTRTPPPPRPADVFTCGLDRCVASQNGPYASSNCSSACRPLGRSEWLGSAQVGRMERYQPIFHWSGGCECKREMHCTCFALTTLIGWDLHVCAFHMGCVCDSVHANNPDGCALTMRI
jgi:hypothetical protein